MVLNSFTALAFVAFGSFFLWYEMARGFARSAYGWNTMRFFQVVFLQLLLFYLLHGMVVVPTMSAEQQNAALIVMLCMAGLGAVMGIPLGAQRGEMQRILETDRSPAGG